MGKSVYRDMLDGRFVHPVYKSYTKQDLGFLQLMLKRGVRDKEGNDLSDLDKMMGPWKFHLSIAPVDVPRAWDIVANTLIEHPYASLAKVTKPDNAVKFSNPQSIQAGKHITIYTYRDLSPNIYKDLLRNIEDKFDAAGIKPGPRSNADRLIPGSRYASYRLEEGPNGEYVSSSSLSHLPRDKRYNPWNSPDPYRNFRISNASDVNIAWQKATSESSPNIVQRVLKDLWQNATTTLESTLTDLGVPIKAMIRKTTGTFSNSLG